MAVPRRNAENDYFSIFERDDVNIDQKKAFALLNIKHTLADLVHDFEYRWLMATFGEVGIGALLARLAEPYGPRRIEFTEADKDNLLRFFETCTTDHAAKQSFGAELERYLTQYYNISGIDEYTTEFPYYDENGRDITEILYQRLFAEIDTEAGNAHMYLDAQFGNFVRDYAKWKQRAHDGATQAKYCYDAAYYADPGSGYNPSDAEYDSVTISDTQIYPATNISLGRDYTLTPVLDARGKPTNIQARWGEADSFGLFDDGNSVEATKAAIVRTSDINTRLDRLLSKTAGDRCQAYSANSAVWPPTTVLVTNDILASLDMIKYQSSPIVLTGKNAYTYYAVGGAVEAVLNDAQKAQLASLIPSQEAFAERVRTLKDTAKLAAEQYFDQLVQRFREGGQIPFRFAPTLDGMEWRATNVFAGAVWFLVEYLEKYGIYETLVQKYNDTEMFASPPDLSGPVGTKYKPLLSQEDMNAYMGVTKIYSNRVSRGVIEKALNPKLYQGSVLAPSSLQKQQLGYFGLLTKAIRSTLAEYVHRENMPINTIALLLGILYYRTFLEEVPERKRRDPAVVAAYDEKRRVLSILMNTEPLLSAFHTIVPEASLVTEGAGVGAGSALSPIVGFAYRADTTRYIFSNISEIFPVLQNILNGIIPGAIGGDTTIADRLNFADIEPVAQPHVNRLYVELESEQTGTARRRALRADITGVDVAMAIRPAAAVSGVKRGRDNDTTVDSAAKRRKDDQTGGGIPNHDMEFVFDVYERVDAALGSDRTLFQPEAASLLVDIIAAAELLHETDSGFYTLAALSDFVESAELYSRSMGKFQESVNRFVENRYIANIPPELLYRLDEMVTRILSQPSGTTAALAAAFGPVKMATGGPAAPPAMTIEPPTVIVGAAGGARRSTRNRGRKRVTKKRNQKRRTAAASRRRMTIRRRK
jgi:hypothetical protein